MVRKYTLNTSSTRLNTGNDIYTPEQYVLVHHVQCTSVHNVCPMGHNKKTPHIQIYSKGMCVILTYMILKSAQ